MSAVLSYDSETYTLENSIIGRGRCCHTISDIDGLSCCMVNAKTEISVHMWPHGHNPEETVWNAVTLLEYLQRTCQNSCCHRETVTWASAAGDVKPQFIGQPARGAG